ALGREARLPEFSHRLVSKRIRSRAGRDRQPLSQSDRDTAFVNPHSHRRVGQSEPVPGFRPCGFSAILALPPHATPLVILFDVPEPVLIDTDTASDDAVALIMALRSHAG